MQNALEILLGGIVCHRAETRDEAAHALIDVAKVRKGERSCEVWQIPESLMKLVAFCAILVQAKFGGHAQMREANVRGRRSRSNLRRELLHLLTKGGSHCLTLV